MKTKKIIGYILILFAMLSCGKMDDVYREFTDPVSNKFYLSKIKGLEFIPGNNRVKMVIPSQVDTRIKGCIIYWDNQQHQLDLPLNVKESQEYIIEDLEPSSYLFEVYSRDDKGNRSIPTYYSVRVLMNAEDDF